MLNRLHHLARSSSFNFIKKSGLFSFSTFNMSTILSIKGRQIFDSRGNPTVEVDLTTKDGLFKAAVPSGASTGMYEALELRDGIKSDYMGKGVLKAVENINTIIAPSLIGKVVTDQKALDEHMVKVLDGTTNEWGWCKSKLGSNAILPVSIAICRAGAASSKMPLYKYIAQLAGFNSGDNAKMVLPVPSFNIINGGKHAGNALAMQEFMIMPVGAKTFKEAMKMGSEIYHTLKSVIKSKYGIDATNVGDEGGFAPNITSQSEAVELINLAIRQAGYSSDKKDSKGYTKICLAMDVAASEFITKDNNYNLNFKSKEPNIVSNTQLLEIFQKLISQSENTIVSIEDGYDQDDFKAWNGITTSIGKDVQIVGDDLLVTNRTRIEKAIQEKLCNALLLKVNQIGSVTESIESVKLSQAAGWGIMTSHRSGETEDSFIADLAVGLNTGQIKTGAPCRSERLSKYNQLLRIEEELGDNAIYAGNNFRFPPKN